jgi:polyribonucleotide nucleotidyltransferase
MFDIHRVELDWGGRKLVLETGKIARQADGAVVATYGESKVTRRSFTPRAAFPAVISSARAVRPRKRRWSHG